MNVPEWLNLNFLKDRELGALYFSMSLRSFAGKLIGIFVPIYLWQIGLPLWQILTFFALASLYYLVIASASAVIFERLNDKMLQIWSIPFFALYFAGLGFLPEYPILFFILPFVISLEKFLFESGYNLDLVNALDQGYMGRQIAAQYVFMSLVGFAAPFMGGVIATWFGFQNLFWVGVAILGLAVLPLFTFKPHCVTHKFDAKILMRYVFDRRIMPYRLSDFAYTIDAALIVFIWPLFIFFSIGNLAAIGGIISLGLILSTLIQYIGGILADSGKHAAFLRLFSSAYAVVVGSRALFPFFPNPLAISVSHVAGDMLVTGLYIPWTSTFNQLAKKSPHPGLFAVSRAVAWHIGRLVFLGLLAVLALISTQTVVFVTAFIVAGIAVLFFQSALRQHI